jgi:two-component sensor histidine kinase
MRRGILAEWRPNGFSLRAHLIAYGVAILLPVMVLAGFLQSRSATLERSQLEARLSQVAGNLAENIDRDIDRQLTVLRTLATSQFLAAEDWPSFYAQAKAALEGKGFLVVIDASLRQMLNTRVPFGQQPAVTGDPETAERIYRTKAPDASDLFWSLIDKRPVINVDLPIVRDSKVRYILVFAQNAEDLLPVLHGQKLPSTWRAAIIDRNGVVIASLPQHASEVGKPAKDVLAVLGEARSARSEVTGADGGLIRVLERSQIAGWIAAVSVPLSEVEAPLRRTSLLWGAVAAFAALLTGTLGWLLASNMTRAMGRATNAARALGAAQPVAVAKSSLAEVNDVVAAMERASTALSQRDEHQRLLLNELSHRVKNVLAVVQAIAMRTLDGRRPMPEARSIFYARLGALARAHDMLNQTEWKGARIRDIVAAELAPFASRAQAGGPDLVLSEHWVQTFALVLHELATNAAKYGSLSSDAGRVSISWSVTGTGDAAQFRFAWREEGGPPVGTPHRKGFGSAILERAIPSDLDVRPRFAFEPSGLLYEIEAPLRLVVRAAEPQAEQPAATATAKQAANVPLRELASEKT